MAVKFPGISVGQCACNSGMCFGKIFPRSKANRINVAAVRRRKYDRGIATLDCAEGLKALRLRLNDCRGVVLSGHRYREKREVS